MLDPPAYGTIRHQQGMDPLWLQLEALYKDLGTKEILANSIADNEHLQTLHEHVLELKAHKEKSKTVVSFHELCVNCHTVYQS